MIDRLGDDCPVALAVSLHAPNDALRDDLVPLNRKYPIAELLEACKRYLDARAARLHHLRVLHARRRATTSPSMRGSWSSWCARARRVVQVQPDSLQSVSGVGPAAFAAAREVLAFAKTAERWLASSPPCARRAATTSMPPAASWPAT